METVFDNDPHLSKDLLNVLGTLNEIIILTTKQINILVKHEFNNIFTRPITIKFRHIKYFSMENPYTVGEG